VDEAPFVAKRFNHWGTLNTIRGLWQGSYENGFSLALELYGSKLHWITFYYFHFDLLLSILIRHDFEENYD